MKRMILATVLATIALAWNATAGSSPLVEADEVVSLGPKGDTCTIKE